MLSSSRRALRRRHGRRWLLPLVALLVAGCGSTVAGSAPRSSGLAVSSSGGVGAPDSSGPSGAPGAPSTTTSAGAGTGTGTGSGGTLPDASQPQQSLAAQVRSGNGPVVVRLGVVYLKGLEQAYKAVNGGKSASTDSHGDYAAVIAAINRRPNSRLRLKPTYYAVDASSTQSQADQLQAACSYFTSDSHVDIVTTYSAGANGALAKCLQAHHLPLVDGFPGAETGGGTFTSTPDLWAPSQLSLDRLGALEPSYLVGHHWVDGKWPATPQCASVTTPRIGVITFDRPDWRAMYDRVVAPTFRSLGHPVYDAVFFNVSGSTGEQVAQASSAAQSAVLKFASECVDHVAFISNVAVDYLFMNVAAQQHYTPRYGLSSLEAPPVVIANLPTSAGSQLHGAIGPGWAPYSDVAAADFDAASQRPSSKCMTILTKAGHPTTDNNSATLALPSCDGPMFVAAVFDRWIAGGARASLLSIVDSIGGGYAPSGTYTASLGNGRHDGAAAYRGLSFVDSCTCFRYVSAVTRL